MATHSKESPCSQCRATEPSDLGAITATPHTALLLQTTELRVTLGGQHVDAMYLRCWLDLNQRFTMSPQATKQCTVRKYFC